MTFSSPTKLEKMADDLEKVTLNKYLSLKNCVFVQKINHPQNMKSRMGSSTTITLPVRYIPANQRAHTSSIFRKFDFTIFSQTKIKSKLE